MAIPHEAGHFLAAHLLGVDVAQIRVGRSRVADKTCGAVKLTDPAALSDREWRLVASAGYGAQLALDISLLPGQAGGDIALLAERGLQPLFLPTCRWMVSMRTELELIIGQITALTSDQGGHIEGRVLHHPRTGSFGSASASSVLQEFGG